METFAISKMRKGASTLPSREDINILKDPPKSVHTRKHEPVNIGDVTHMVRENPDRTSDAIQLYARGVNPAVSVEYQNRGGGGTRTSVISQSQASNPYNVVHEGAFRPPLFRPIEDGLPLSRQKRDWTSVTSKPGGPEADTFYQRTVNEKGINKNPIRKAVHTSYAYNIQKSAKPYVGNAVLDPLTFSIITQQLDPRKYVDNKPIELSGQGALRDEDHTLRKQIGSRARYTHGNSNDGVGEKRAAQIASVDLRSHPVASAIGGGNQTIAHTSIDEFGQPTMSRHVVDDKDMIRGTASTYASKQHRYNLSELSYPEIHLARLTPHQTVNANIHYQIQSTPDTLMPILDDNRPIVAAYSLPSRPNDVDNWFREQSVKLPDKIQPGGFSNAGFVPTILDRDLEPSTLSQTPIQELRTKVRSQFSDRFQSNSAPEIVDFGSF